MRLTALSDRFLRRLMRGSSFEVRKFECRLQAPATRPLSRLRVAVGRHTNTMGAVLVSQRCSELPSCRATTRKRQHAGQIAWQRAWQAGQSSDRRAKLGLLRPCMLSAGICKSSSLSRPCSCLPSRSGVRSGGVLLAAVALRVLHLPCRV